MTKTNTLQLKYNVTPRIKIVIAIVKEVNWDITLNFIKIKYFRFK